MSDYEEAFKRIDSVITNIDSRKKEPDFSMELKGRKERKPSLLGDNDETLRHFARLIASSQNAKSGLVSDMLNAGKFEKVFNNFAVDSVAQMNPADVKASHWGDVTVIRYPGKIDSIIKCAISLQSIRAKHGSFVNLLDNSRIPLNILSKTDIDIFWNRFENLKEELTILEMPFFKNTTSLLHLLLHVGYPCLKPDLKVMKEALKFGAVKSTAKTPRNLKQAVLFFQYYSVSRNIKPSILDFYLLVDGKQDWAKRYVDQSYYALDSKSPFS